MVVDCIIHFIYLLLILLLLLINIHRQLFNYLFFKGYLRNKHPREVH